MRQVPGSRTLEQHPRQHGCWHAPFGWQPCTGAYPWVLAHTGRWNGSMQPARREHAQALDQGTCVADSTIDSAPSNMTRRHASVPVNQAPADVHAEKLGRFYPSQRLRSAPPTLARTSEDTSSGLTTITSGHDAMIMPSSPTYTPTQSEPSRVRRMAHMLFAGMVHCSNGSCVRTDATHAQCSLICCLGSGRTLAPMLP